MDLQRPPDRVFFAQDTYTLRQGTPSAGAWSHDGTEVSFHPGPDSLGVDVRAEGLCAPRIVLRWANALPAKAQFLGDHWERGYGDLAWRGFVPERVMPWYMLGHSRGRTTGWGVRTGAGALCFWTADPRGVSLWIDLRCGTEPVLLNGRTLRAAEIVTREFDTSPFQAATSFCRLLCTNPRPPGTPIYGGNDWYYAYGKSTHESLVRDSASLSRWAGSAANRPFSVIDDGWQFHQCANSSPWLRPHPNFPDMTRLAREIRDTGCRPGIWIRPLHTLEPMPQSWALPNRGGVPAQGVFLDPSVPEVLGKVTSDMRTLVSWGYELVKHDFSTYDILTKWGFEMGAALTSGTWTFQDRSRTTAEIILGLYRAIREGAGDAFILGCNTIGHLGAGLFEIQRTGDDTSGRDWERTRRMGVNTLAFRMPQHGTFFAVDADCVGLTNAVPWDLNCQWLALLAASGTPLFVSASPEAIGPRQEAALRDAFAAASVPAEPAEPLDWMENTCPQRWRIGGKVRKFNWTANRVASPFMMG